MLFASCVAVRTLLAETRTFHSLSIARAGGWCVWGPPPRRHANLLGLHTSACVRGLEEFFPKSDDLIDEGEKAGTLRKFLKLPSPNSWPESFFN